MDDGSFLLDGLTVDNRTKLVIFTARANARAVLGVVILSVCPSVLSVYLSHALIVTKLNDALQTLSLIHI